MTKNNQLILQNYAYLALFESKYTIYHNERIASSIEKILEILQYIFLRDITDKEYSYYLYEIAILGTYVLKKSAEFKNISIIDIQNFKLIKSLLDTGKQIQDSEHYCNSIPKFENALQLITNAISQNEEGKNLLIIAREPSTLNIKIFEKEYNILFLCIKTNNNIYRLIRGSEAIKFPNDEISSIVSRDTAIHEIHQGFTHLTRHINQSLSNFVEIDRFKSHIRRAALDLLKLSIESMRNFFIKTHQISIHNELSIKLSIIKNQEVIEIVSTAMPDFKQRYTTLITNYTKYLT